MKLFILAAPQFSVRHILCLYEELTAGMLAAGAGHVIVMPLSPCSFLRPGDVSAAVYRRRRRLVNQVLCRQFYRPRANPDVSFRQFVFNDDFLGTDGAHPSVAGWRALEVGGDCNVQLRFGSHAPSCVFLRVSVCELSVFVMSCFSHCHSFLPPLPLFCPRRTNTAIPDLTPVFSSVSSVS